VLYANTQEYCSWANRLNESFKGFSHKRNEGFFSLFSIGFFLVLIGVVFATTPDLFDEVLGFFHDFTVVSVPRTDMRLPAPSSPWAHSVVYSAMGKFSLAWGLSQIFILVLRIVAGSPLGEKVKTVSSLVFWLGASVLIHTFLNEMTTKITWFVFWAAIVMLVGVSLIARALILAAWR
jgi:hypothetical protein